MQIGKRGVLRSPRLAIGALLFIVGMFFVVQPLVGRLCRWMDGGIAKPQATLPSAAVPIAFVAVLLSALATEAIGVHAVFGEPFRK